MSIALAGPMRRTRRVYSLAITWKHPIVWIGYLMVAAQLGFCTIATNFSESPLAYLLIAAPIPWLLMAHARFRPHIQVPRAVIGLLALQVWSVVAGVVAAGVIVKELDINDQVLLFGNYASIYLETATLVALVPESRKIVFGIIFAFIFGSCLLGALQFAHVGFAVKIQNASFRVYEQARTYFEQNQFSRASGFSPGQSTFGVYAALGTVMLLAQLRSRMLRWWEWLVLALAAFGVLACQTRSILLPTCLSVVVGAVYVCVRYKVRGILAVLITSLGVIGVLVAKGKSFGYVSGKHLVAVDTLVFRHTVSWPQLTPIWRRFPWTGIGPDWRFARLHADARSKAIAQTDKWVRWGTFDGSYHHLLATLGIIGAVLFAFVGVATVVGLIKVLLDERESQERRNLALGLLLMCAVLVVLFVTFEDLWWKESMWPVMMAFGLSSRTLPETLDYLRSAGPSKLEEAWRRIKGIFRRRGEAPQAA